LTVIRLLPVVRIVPEIPESMILGVKTVVAAVYFAPATCLSYLSKRDFALGGFCVSALGN
jgi:hypothetical protein